MKGIVPDGKQVRFDVFGTPVPQGSKRGFVTPKGKVVVVEQGKGHKSWRQEVANQAMESRTPEILAEGPWDGPVEVYLTFWLPKPKSAPKGWTLWQFKRPDLDKLTRSVLDSLTGAIYKDDGQVSALTARKWFAIDRQPGLTVVVRRLDPLGV